MSTLPTLFNIGCANFKNSKILKPDTMKRSKLIKKYEKEKQQLHEVFVFADDMKAFHITLVINAMIDTYFVLLIDLKSNENTKIKTKNNLRNSAKLG